MVTFTRPVEAVPDLYVGASSTGSDGGWLGYVLPNAPADLTSLTLGDAFGAQAGSFVFASAAPPLGGDEAATLVANVVALLADGVRRCIWLETPGDVSAATTVAFGFDAGAGTLRLGAKLPLGAGGNLLLNVVNGSGIDAPQDALVLSQGRGGAAPVAWDGPSALTGGLISSATIPCAGPQRGCVTFAQDVDDAALNSHLSWGFQTAIADAGAPSGTRIGWYPLAASTGDQVALAIAVDPTDSFNAGGVERTAFAFTDKTTSLASGYRTNAGWVVTLAPVTSAENGAQPARLWLHASAPDATAKRDFVACPAGDFVLGVDAPQGATAAPALLCGLSGTETIAFAAGDTMRFKPQQPAFAARFPYPPASPVAAPIDPVGAKLDATFLTSWASLVTAADDGGHYSAQPKGASLYQKPDTADAGVLLFAEPGTTLAAGAPLPLLPYALVAAGTGATYSVAQYADVETKVVAAARRGAVSTAGLRRAAAPAAKLLGAAGDGGTKPATTPAGLVVQVDQTTGAYTRVDLAQDVTRDPAVTMQLTQPSDAMHEALQTSQLLLVKANVDGLGTLAGWPPVAPSGTGFYNAMTIGDWALLADVGRHRAYGDYANVMIVKGRHGKLRDLVKTPDVWTQPTLAIPSGATGNASELTALSQWMDDYLTAAANETSDYFDAFNALVEDETWTGVLVLKGEVAAVPPELTGMLGGVDKQQFNAHHFGFTITKVDPATVAMSGNSATFGLIYYVDPAFDVAQSPPQPVAPTATPWDFKVLTLKALFANASVERFESYAQLTLGQLFGQPVDHMGGPGANPYDALILSGSLHKQGGRTSYGLEAQGDSTFFFQGGVINKVEVLQADFSTTAQEPQKDGSTRVSSRFDLFGFLDFRQLSGDGGPFDVFSFGSSVAQPQQRGLSLSGLGVTMTFDEPADPTQPSTPPVYAFDVSKVAFDAARSTPRDDSLVPSLGLEVAGLVTGDKDTPPSSLGYVDVGTPLRLPGVRGDWYGLKLKANFGTPGALAGDVGLTSYLLLAWSPASGGSQAPAALGLLLPGAGQGSSLLSLQGVMKLSVGPVLLAQVPTKAGGKAFMLAISEIALKFLGLLKLPPSGATAFYLFGDTTGDGGPLGWFALYKGPDPPTPAPPAIKAGASG